MEEAGGQKAMKQFCGVIAAVYAAYDDSGAVCMPRARAQAQELLNAGVDGLFVNGSAGEGFLLSVEERMRMAEAVIEENNGRRPVMVQVGAAALRDALALAHHAARAGAQAIAAVPSVYYRLTESEIACMWNTLANESGIPLYLYNIPGATGYTLSEALFTRMLANPLVRGIKESSRDVACLTTWRRLADADFNVINGADDQYLAGRMAGADGGIGGMYAAMPEAFVALEGYIRAANLNGAQCLQTRINEWIAACKGLHPGGSFIGGCKALLQARGIPLGGVRAPLLPFPADRMRDAEALYARILSDTFNTLPQ